MIKPVLKWAGGKRTILHLIHERISHVYSNDNSQRFIDLFAGGASVSISLLDKFDKVIMNDINKDLINVYQQIKDNPTKLISELEKHTINHSEEYYYQIREWDRKKGYNNRTNYSKAARMIYLNKTCFNGLYRVNSKGEFNVPIGKPLTNRNIYDAENIIKLSRSFSNTIFINDDYINILKIVKRGDIVYLDPPYDILKDDSFVNYTKNGFARDDQIKVFNLFEKLTEKQVYVILSNSATDFIIDLFKDYIDDDSFIQVRRSISAKAKSRVLANEILIDNFKVINNGISNKTK